MSSTPALLVCPLCAHPHEFPALAPGEGAQCVRCGTLMARGESRVGQDAALAFTITGLLLAGPALLLPFVEVSKYQAQRASNAFDGVRALWDAGMPLLAIWVFLCGIAVPRHHPPCHSPISCRICLGFLQGIRQRASQFRTD